MRYTEISARQYEVRIERRCNRAVDIQRIFADRTLNLSVNPELTARVEVKLVFEFKTVTCVQCQG